jgi:hypothetical protein
VLAVAHAQWRQGAVEVFPHRAGELRLAAVGLDHAGIGADVGEGAIEQLGANPGGRASLRKPACHSAKVWVGWMSRLSARHHRR